MFLRSSTNNIALAENQKNENSLVMPNERENYLCVKLFLFFLSVFFRHLLDLTVIALIAGIYFSGIAL